MPPSALQFTTGNQRQQRSNVKNAALLDGKTSDESGVVDHLRHKSQGRDREGTEQADRAEERLEEDDTVRVAGLMPYVSSTTNERDIQITSQGADHSSPQASTAPHSNITVTHGQGAASQASAPVRQRRRRRYDDLSIDGTANLDLHQTATTPTIKKLYLWRGRWWEVEGSERPAWAEAERMVQQEATASTPTRGTKRRRGD